MLGVSPAGAVDPLQDLTEEELKLVAIWAHRPMGYQRAVECLPLGAHKLLEKEAATKEGERAALEKSISRDLGRSELPNVVLNRLVAGEFSLEEEAELERLETSQTKLAIQARAMRLHSLRRLLDHAATAGSVLEARLRSTRVFSEVVEAFDKAEACRQAEDQARDAVFRRQLNEIQLGQSSRTIPQIVREARKRLRAKKHRLQLSAKLNQEISTALREKILDGSRDVRLAAGSTWKVEDNLDELDYPPGTWWCRRCQGTSRGTGDCQGYLRGQRCSGSFASTFHSWARTAVGADLLRAASGKRRSERVRQEIAPSLKEAGWKCNRCQAENLALRDKCYKCSGPISERQLDVLRETREELRATGGSVPQRTSKRGGTKRKRAGQSRAADSSAGAASSSAAGPSGGKGGSRGDPVVSTDHAVPESDDRDWSWSRWQDYDRWDEWDWRHGGHREWEDRRGDRQGRDDYYDDYHYDGGSREDRQGWDDYYEDRHQDYYEDRRWEYHREDDRSGWRDWDDQDDQDDEWYGRARWRSRRRLPRQSALANPVSSFEKKQLSAGEELSALVPVSDRSSFEFEGLVEECPTLVRVVDGQGSTSRGFVWGALCFAAAVLSSTRVVVLRGLRCLWCLSAAQEDHLRQNFAE